MSRICVAIVGPGDKASSDAIADAAAVGRLVAERGWVMLCGGRAAGVMESAARAVRDANGIAIGILPGTDRNDASLYLTVALPTGLGEARNAVLVTAADAVIACGMSSGTASEVSLALRTGKLIVLVRPSAETRSFFESVTPNTTLHIADTPEAAVAWIETSLSS
jgi:hypothetical protein